MAAAGLDISGLLARGDFGYESGEKGARRLLSLKDPVTAIIASSNQMALASMTVARSQGLDVPADLSLISFDDTPIARLSTPALTAIDQPIAATASRAVELIIASRNGNEVPDDPVVMAAALIARESTGPAPKSRRHGR
jgi:LacI family transcriptional regulator